MITIKHTTDTVTILDDRPGCDQLMKGMMGLLFTFCSIPMFIGTLLGYGEICIFMDCHPPVGWERIVFAPLCGGIFAWFGLILLNNACQSRVIIDRYARTVTVIRQLIFYRRSRVYLMNHVKRFTVIENSQSYQLEMQLTNDDPIPLSYVLVEDLGYLQSIIGELQALLKQQPSGEAVTAC